MSINTHYLFRLWRENGEIFCEIEFVTIFEPSLILNLNSNERSIEDWFQESIEENIGLNIYSFLPDNLEICEEPILLEGIGTYSVQAWKDYWGEYDEDFDFNLTDWSVAIEEEEMVELTTGDIP